MKNGIVNFEKLAEEIKENKILLPDFQRKFEWKEEERQKKLAASVLAKLPIGSILLLESEPDEFSAKAIGRQKQIILKKEQGRKVRFLLDGQQRLTVLSNVFSNLIFEETEDFSDLCDRSLRLRFFLRLPKYSSEEDDLFGIRKLRFPLIDPADSVPEFLNSEIFNFIETKPCTQKEMTPFHPKKNTLDYELDNFCLGQKEGYWVPLYLLVADKKNREKNERVLRRILKGIAGAVATDLQSEFENREEKEQEKLIFDTFPAEQVKEEMEAWKQKYGKNADINYIEIFHNLIHSQGEYWAEQMMKYLDSCVTHLNLIEMVVMESERNRAIDIYQNLNLGGVELNAFDLVMAKAAKVSKQNLRERMCAYVEKMRSYPIHSAPEQIQKILEEKMDMSKYTASNRAECLESGELNKKYVEVFLNVLSLYAYNKEMQPDKVCIDQIKRKKILEISPNDINNYSEQVCDAIDHAFYFLQTRCGICRIKDIKYSLVLVLLSFMFMKNDWFEDKKKQDLLEAWYWSAILSGEYDKDQNGRLISNIQSMLRTIRGESRDWIRQMAGQILNAQNFSDESFLLMENVENLQRTPKEVIRNTICQFFLSQTYPALFQKEILMSVFTVDIKRLHLHHVIPIASVKKIKDSARATRADKKALINSPLNFIYILDAENAAIGDKNLQEYQEEINGVALDKLGFVYPEQIAQEEGVKIVLKQRYKTVQSKIYGRVEALL